MWFEFAFCYTKPFLRMNVVREDRICAWIEVDEGDKNIYDKVAFLRSVSFSLKCSYNLFFYSDVFVANIIKLSFQQGYNSLFCSSKNIIVTLFQCCIPTGLKCQ